MIELFTGFAPEEADRFNQGIPPFSEEELMTWRKKYANSPIALQLIDMKDPESRYNQLYSQLKQALKEGDYASADQLESQIIEEYPDIR